MCIFCSIVKGEIPATRIYEDDTVLAILDISQVTKGHARNPQAAYREFHEL